MTAWQAFFAWPAGGVWANMLAWVIGLVLAAGAGWLLRDHIGRRLAAWLHKHHQAHLEQLAAAAPVRAGAAGNPAEGLPADAAARGYGAAHQAQRAAVIHIIKADPDDPEFHRKFDVWFRSYLRRHGIGAGLL